MKYEWNTDNLAALAKGMDQSKETVDKQRAILEECIKVSEAAFQGDAGEAFMRNLQSDLEKMKELSSLLDIQSRKLRMVAEKYYGSCEESLQAKVQELKATP